MASVDGGPVSVVILAREMPDVERIAASQFFTVIDLVSQVKPGDTVICRYSIYPFANEVLANIESMGGTPINSAQQLDYTFNIDVWSKDFSDLTPRVYAPGEPLPNGGSFVLKGGTYSKKWQWNTHMFAATKDDVPAVREHLLDDTWLSNKPIFVRDHIPLVTFTTGMNGLPITKEFRLFFAGGDYIGGGYYWSSHVGDLQDLGIPIPSVGEVPTWLIDTIRDTTKSRSNFLAADVAQTVEGKWILIEINEGQMSGLSEIDPVEFYRNLLFAVTGVMV